MSTGAIVWGMTALVALIMVQLLTLWRSSRNRHDIKSLSRTVQAIGAAQDAVEQRVTMALATMDANAERRALALDARLDLLGSQTAAIGRLLRSHFREPELVEQGFVPGRTGRFVGSREAVRGDTGRQTSSQPHRTRRSTLPDDDPHASYGAALMRQIERQPEHERPNIARPAWPASRRPADADATEAVVERKNSSGEDDESASD